MSCNRLSALEQSRRLQKLVVPMRFSRPVIRPSARRLQLLCLLALTSLACTVSHATHADVPAGDVASAERELRPIYTRPAQTAPGLLLDGFLEYVEGLDIQEAVDLKGWTAGLDLTWPFRERMQLRLLMPLRTDADARLEATGEKTRIEGWGGVYDFTTLFFEHQVLDAGSDHMAWYFGYGHRLGVLETSTPDRYNHQGQSAHVGIRYDRRSGRSLLSFDLGTRFYIDSDDLNPGSEIDDRFWLWSLRGAWLWQASEGVAPGLELTADGVSGWTAVSLVPEVVVNRWDNLDLKLGVPIGVTDDAPDFGVQTRVTFRF